MDILLLPFKVTNCRVLTDKSPFHTIYMHGKLHLPCLALPSLTLLCLAVPYFALLCRPLLCLALPCRPLLCLALPCFAVPYFALPCLALPSLTLPCLAFPSLALPCFNMISSILKSSCCSSRIFFSKIWNTSPLILYIADKHRERPFDL